MIQALILTALLVGQTSSEDRLGLTDRQILNLGAAKFVDRYSEKNGSSTAAMSGAIEVYGLAIRRLNTAALLEKPSSTRKAALDLRVRMTAFRSEMCDVGSAFSGGGTMWNIVYNETLAEVEEALTVWSGLRSTKPKSRVVSDVTKALGAVERSASKHRSDIETMKESGGGMAEVTSSLKKARAQYTEIVKLLAKRSRRESDAVLDFCVRAANIPLGQLEGD